VRILVYNRGVEHRVAHSLSTEQARSAARAAADEYAARLAHHDVRVVWADPDHATISFRAAGKSFEARVRLEPGAAVVSMDVPLLLRPLAGRATAAIDRHVRAALERFQSG